MGTELFVRSSSGVALTQAGKQFVEHGRKALYEIEMAMTEPSFSSSDGGGNLRIGILSSLASGFLSNLIQMFSERYARTTLTFVDGNSAEHIEAIRQQKLDIAFITTRDDWSGCSSQNLWSERIFAVLPDHHRSADRVSVQLSSLAHEVFVVSESAPGEEIQRYLTRRLGDLELRPQIHQHGVGRDNLMQLVALGRGLTVTSEATTAARFPGVVFRPIENEILPFCAVWLPGNDNPALLAMLDLARSMAGGENSQSSA